MSPLNVTGHTNYFRYGLLGSMGWRYEPHHALWLSCRVCYLPHDRLYYCGIQLALGAKRGSAEWLPSGEATWGGGVGGLTLGTVQIGAAKFDVFKKK